MNNIPLRFCSTLIKGSTVWKPYINCELWSASPFTLAREAPLSCASCNVGEQCQAEQRRKRRQRREG